MIIIREMMLWKGLIIIIRVGIEVVVMKDKKIDNRCMQHNMQETHKYKNLMI